MAFTRVEAEMFKVSSVLHEPLMFSQFIEKLKFHILLLCFSNFFFKRKKYSFFGNHNFCVIAIKFYTAVLFFNFY